MKMCIELNIKEIADATVEKLKSTRPIKYSQFYVDSAKQVGVLVIEFEEPTIEQP